MIPSFLSPEMAKKIMLTGKSVVFIHRVCHDNTQLNQRESIRKAMWVNLYVYVITSYVYVIVSMWLLNIMPNNNGFYVTIKVSKIPLRNSQLANDFEQWLALCAFKILKIQLCSLVNTNSIPKGATKISVSALFDIFLFWSTTTNIECVGTPIVRSFSFIIF